MRSSDGKFLGESRFLVNGQRRAPLSRLLATNIVCLTVAGVCFAGIGLLGWQLATPGRAGTLSRTPHRLFLLIGVSYALIWSAYLALGRGTARSKLARSGLTTASILFCWALLELPALLGIVDYRLLLSPGGGGLMSRIKPWEDPRNQFDRELMYTRRPGERIVGETTGDLVYWLGISTQQRYHVDAQYDRHGFRNDHEIGAASVAVIGDSFVEAGLLAPAQMLSTRLSRLLSVEVANLGLGGYGPQQELVVLRRYALPLHPQVVVWCFFEGNDLLDVSRYQEFARDADAHLKELYSFTNRSFTHQAWQALANATASRSTLDGTEAHRRSCRLRGGDSGAADTIYFDYAAAPLSPTESASLDVAESQLLEAQRMTAASGAAMMLVYVPIKFRVYEGLCEPPADGYARTWTLNDLPNRLAQWSAAHNLPFLDLTSALKERAAHGELVYFPDDGHWNPIGNAVAAGAIGDAITTYGWLSVPH